MFLLKRVPAMSINEIFVRAARFGSLNRLYTSDFARKVIETFGTRLLLIGIGLITGVIVTRTLGPEGRGLYAAATAIGAIGVQFGNLGLHASNTYYVAQARALLPKLLGNSLVVSFGWGGFAVLVAWLIFSLRPALAPVQGALLALALVVIPFNLAYLFLQNLLIGIQEVRLYNTVELVVRLLATGLIALVIWLNIVSPITILLAVSATMLMGMVWIGRRLVRQAGNAISLSLALFRTSFRYGFKAYLAAFFSYLVLRVDLLMIKQMLGATQTGYYSVAANMTDMVLMLPVVVGSLLFPKLAAVAQPAVRRAYAQKVALLVGAIMIFLAFTFALLARAIVVTLYGQEFGAAAPAFIWLMPATVFMAINTIFMNFFAASGMPLITVYSPAIAAGLNVALNFWLLPDLGIIGASISSIAAYGLMLLFSLAYFYSKGRNRDAA
jgi:O-antigen/teichoic acid export membrane protein